jgi:hypothetical protein
MPAPPLDRGQRRSEYIQVMSNNHLALVRASYFIQERALGVRDKNVTPVTILDQGPTECQFNDQQFELRRFTPYVRASPSIPAHRSDDVSESPTRDLARNRH